MRHNREQWRQVLPADWTMVLWDNEKAREQWPEYAEVEHRCFHHATRADLILARAQRDYGGLAMGTDVQPACVSNLLQWLDVNGTLVVVNPKDRSASNGISYFRETGHPFISAVCRHQLRDLRNLSDKNVWWSTGPGCWYEVLASQMWNLALATDARAYTRYWNGEASGNPQAWVDPGYAASWHS